ncbi:MAG: hypothetical protein WA615_07350 [Bradyrhizobium sp.]
MGFEHCLTTLGLRGDVRNATEIAPIWHGLCLDNCTCIRRDGAICSHKQFIQRYLGEFQECFNSTTRGYTMPAFTFEKISPPIRRGPLPPIAKKQRGLIVQILDRFVEARVKRTVHEEKGVVARRRRKPPD